MEDLCWNVIKKLLDYSWQWDEVMFDEDISV